jgi:hypothetical protein
VRRAARLLLFALTLALSACGGDDGGGDEAAADAAGAFGGADDCEQLVAQTVEARARVVEALGDARRTDTERIDEALTSFGGDGPDLAVRYDGLGCDRSFDEAVCAAMGDLEATGPAGEDLVATWAESCG